MPQMRNVYSSHVNQIGYSAETEQLFVQYKDGKTAVYKDVPPEKAKIVMGSASIGSALHEHIKGQHEHEYL